jgi:hypothetical protein
MSTSTRFRLRRIDRKQDARTKTYATRVEAEAALDALPPTVRPRWEIQAHTSGPSGSPVTQRKSPIRSFTLAPEVYEAIGRLAERLGIAKAKVVSDAVIAYAARFDRRAAAEADE